MEVSKIFRRGLTLGGIIKFFTNIYHSQKFPELFSFIVWELKYRLFGYKDEKVMQFSNEVALNVLTLDSKWPTIGCDTFEFAQSKVNWFLVFIDGQQDQWGSICGDLATLYHYSREGELIRSYLFDGKISGVYISSAGRVFCCAKGILYMSTLDEKSFEKVVEFSTVNSKFRQDAFTESPSGDLFVGEYVNIFENKRWKFAGYIYHSCDGGASWKKIDFLQKVGVNKHLHIVKWSKLIEGLIMTDGDNQKNVWLNKSATQFDQQSASADTGWKKLNNYHIQKGGYTGVVELDNRLLFGSDYNGGTNFIISTKDMLSFEEKVIPDPYRRAIVDRMVLRKNKLGAVEIWATLVFKHSSKVRSLIMMSSDEGHSWKKVIEYDGTQFGIDLVSNSIEIGDELFLLVLDKKEHQFSNLHIRHPEADTTTNGIQN